MARRVLDRRLKVGRPPAQTAEQYLLYFPSKELFHDPGRFPRIDAPHLFHNAQPLHLEIGCGTGDYLCALAQANPACNFVGVDHAVRPLWQAVASAAALALPNIIFIKADMRLLYRLLVPGSLHAVDLHFPDPNMRPRFRKHRLFSSRFLDYMYCALVPGGRISIMTDVLPLLLDMLDVAEQDPRFGKAHLERYLVGFDPIARSRFQRIWERHGCATVRFELQNLRETPIPNPSPRGYPGALWAEEEGSLTPLSSQERFVFVDNAPYTMLCYAAVEDSSTLVKVCLPVGCVCDSCSTGVWTRLRGHDGSFACTPIAPHHVC